MDIAVNINRQNYVFGTNNHTHVLPYYLLPTNGREIKVIIGWFASLNDSGQIQ